MKHIIFSFSFLVFSFISQARMRLEPYTGMGLSYSATGFNKQFFTSRTFGIRIGYELLLFNTGIDVSWNYYNTENSSAVTLSKPENKTIGFSQAAKSLLLEDHNNKQRDFTPLSIGLFGSVDLPIFSNLYGTLFYTFGKKIENISYQGVGIKTGFTIVSIFNLRLNASAQVVQYFCANVVEKKSKVSSESECTNFNIESVMLTLSLPFTPGDLSFFGNNEFNVDVDDEARHFTVNSMQ